MGGHLGPGLKARLSVTFVNEQGLRWGGGTRKELVLESGRWSYDPVSCPSITPSCPGSLPQPPANTLLTSPLLLNLLATHTPSPFVFSYPLTSPLFPAARRASTTAA